MLSTSITVNRPYFHPLFFITGACILGIAWQYTQIHLLFALLLITIVLAIRHTTLYRSTTLIISMLALFCFGAYRYSLVQKNHTQSLEQLTVQPLDIVATITDRTAVDHPLYKQRLTLSVQEIIDKESLPSMHRSLFVYTTAHACLDLEVADTVVIKDIVIKKPSSSSYNKFLMKEGVIASVFTSDVHHTLLHRPSYSYTRWFSTLKNKTVESLADKMEAQSHHLFASLFLGNKPVPKKILAQTKEHFNTWGVAHYLARSGLHMVIVGMTWHTLLSFLPFSYALRTMLLIILCIMYGLLSWPTISFNRALMSFVLYKMCDLWHMPTQLLHTITIVCLGVILYNPLQIFFLDFQLSFGLTCALALFTHLKQKSPNY